MDPTIIRVYKSVTAAHTDSIVCPASVANLLGKAQGKIAATEGRGLEGRA